MEKSLENFVRGAFFWCRVRNFRRFLLERVWEVDSVVIDYVLTFHSLVDQMDSMPETLLLDVTKKKQVIQ
jgi:hypothetical protein